MNSVVAGIYLLFGILATTVVCLDNYGGVFKLQLGSIPSSMIKDDKTGEDIEVEIEEDSKLIKRVEFLERKIENLERERYRDRKKLENVADRQRESIRNMERKHEKQPAEEYQMGPSTATHGLPEPIAFTVHFKRDPVRNLKDNGTIKYDAIITNSGSAYSPRTGLFTAPVSGLYQFFISVMCTEGKYMELMLKVKDKIVASAHASGNRRKWYDSGSSEVVVFLKAGETTRVQKCCGHSKMRGKAHSIFTGFLIN